MSGDQIQEIATIVVSALVGAVIKWLHGKKKRKSGSGPL